MKNRKINISTKILIVMIIALIISTIFSKSNPIVSNVAIWLFGISSLYFMGWLIFNVGKIGNIKYKKKEVVFLIVISSLTIAMYVWIIINRKTIYQWDALTYYVGNLNLLNNFEAHSFLEGIKQIVKSTYQSDYGHFLLSFITLPFSLTNRTENAFILVYSVTIVTPVVIIFSMIAKKIVEMFQYRNKLTIEILVGILLIIFPLLHAASIAGQPDIIGLIFVGCIILLTIDYDFSKMEWNRLIVLIIATICLIISRRWYLFWLVGYVISYLVCLITKLTVEKKYDDLKKTLRNLAIFGCIASVVILLLLFPMIKRIMKQDFSSYTAWSVGGYSKEIQIQIQRVGFLYLLVMGIGIIYGIKDKKLRYLTIGMIINYLIAFLGFVNTQNTGFHQSLIFLPTYIGLFCFGILGICQIRRKWLRLIGKIAIIIVLITSFIGTICNNRYFYNNLFYTIISLKPTKRSDYDNIGKMVQFIQENCTERDIVYINAAGSYCAQTFSSYIHPDLSLSKICVYEASIDSAHGFPIANIAKAKYIFTTNVRIEATGAQLGHIIPAINEALNKDSAIKHKFKLVQEFKMTEKVTFYAFERIEKLESEEAQYWKDIFKEETKKYPKLFGDRIDQYLKIE